MTKNIITTLGFLMCGVGILSVIYKMIGLQLSFLVWIDQLGVLPATLIRLFMIFGGIIMIYLTRTEMDV